MPHIIEVGPQVKIYYSVFSLINRLSHSVDRFLRCPFRSVSIRPRLEIGFEDRFQDELECSLDHAIADRGNREDADLGTSVLRNLLLPCSHGPIRVGDQFVSDLLKETFLSAFFDGLERDPVDSWSPVVLLCHQIGFVKRLRFADVDVESPEAPGWFSLRLDV